MAIRNILQIGDPVLNKKCFSVEDFGEKTAELLNDMRDTLNASGGVGLAAPQVGVLRRALIISYENTYLECINPVILSSSGKSLNTEGCLSVKGKYGTVERPTLLKVKFFDRYGKVVQMKIQGYLARIFCHEFDHLEGILYTQRAIDITEEK